MYRQAQNILAFHGPIEDFQQQLGLFFAFDMANCGVALAEAMALRALSCSKSGVRRNPFLVCFMAAAHYVHSLDQSLSHTLHRFLLLLASFCSAHSSVVMR